MDGRGHDCTRQGRGCPPPEDQSGGTVALLPLRVVSLLGAGHGSIRHCRHRPPGGAEPSPRPRDHVHSTDEQPDGYRSETAIARGDRRAFLRNLLATILLGLMFVGGVAFEWTTAEFHLSDPYGTAFFSMTGLHASHVVSGILMLGLPGHFSAEKH